MTRLAGSALAFLLWSSCGAVPGDLPQPLVADYEDLATAVARDLLLGSDRLDCPGRMLDEVSTTRGRWGCLVVAVRLQELGGSWQFRAPLGAHQLNGPGSGLRCRNDIIGSGGKAGIGAMPTWFSSGWPPTTICQRQLKDLAKSVQARHRQRFAARFPIAEPADRDRGLDEGPNRFESAAEFLARTAPSGGGKARAPIAGPSGVRRSGLRQRLASNFRVRLCDPNQGFGRTGRRAAPLLPISESPLEDLQSLGT